MLHQQSNDRNYKLAYGRTNQSGLPVVEGHGLLALSEIGVSPRDKREASQLDRP